MTHEHVLQARKVNVVTLGAENIFDSEVMMAQLRANDFEVEHEAKQDDSGIVIVGTCGFIEAAKQETVGTISGSPKPSRGKAGACTSRDVSRSATRKSSQTAFQRWTTGLAPATCRVCSKPVRTTRGTRRRRLLTTPARYAYLKIAGVRVLVRSAQSADARQAPLDPHGGPRGPGQGARQARRVEIILIAQDLTYYGLDLYRERKLAELVRRLSDVEGMSGFVCAMPSPVASRWMCLT